MPTYRSFLDDEESFATARPGTGSNDAGKIHRSNAMKKTILEGRWVHQSGVDMVPNSWKVLHMRNIATTYLLLEQDRPRST
jgi:hypothetical protein